MARNNTNTPHLNNSIAADCRRIRDRYLQFWQEHATSNYQDRLHHLNHALSDLRRRFDVENQAKAEHYILPSYRIKQSILKAFLEDPSMVHNVFWCRPLFDKFVEMIVDSNRHGRTQKAWTNATLLLIGLGLAAGTIAALATGVGAPAAVAAGTAAAEEGAAMFTAAQFGLAVGTAAGAGTSGVAGNELSKDNRIIVKDPNASPIRLLFEQSSKSGELDINFNTNPFYRLMCAEVILSAIEQSPSEAKDQHDKRIEQLLMGEFNKVVNIAVFAARYPETHRIASRLIHLCPQFDKLTVIGLNGSYNSKSLFVEAMEHGNFGTASFFFNRFYDINKPTGETPQENIEDEVCTGVELAARNNNWDTIARLGVDSRFLNSYRHFIFNLPPNNGKLIQFLESVNSRRLAQQPFDDAFKQRNERVMQFLTGNEGLTLIVDDAAVDLICPNSEAFTENTLVRLVRDNNIFGRYIARNPSKLVQNGNLEYSLLGEAIRDNNRVKATSYFGDLAKHFNDRDDLVTFVSNELRLTMLPMLQQRRGSEVLVRLASDQETREIFNAAVTAAENALANGFIGQFLEGVDNTPDARATNSFVLEFLIDSLTLPLTPAVINSLMANTDAFEPGFFEGFSRSHNLNAKHCIANPSIVNVAGEVERLSPLAQLVLGRDSEVTLGTDDQAARSNQLVEEIKQYFLSRPGGMNNYHNFMAGELLALRTVMYRAIVSEFNRVKQDGAADIQAVNGTAMVAANLIMYQHLAYYSEVLAEKVVSGYESLGDDRRRLLLVLAISALSGRALFWLVNDAGVFFDSELYDRYTSLKRLDHENASTFNHKGKLSQMSPAVRAFNKGSVNVTAKIIAQYLDGNANKADIDLLFNEFKAIFDIAIGKQRYQDLLDLTSHVKLSHHFDDFIQLNHNRLFSKFIANVKTANQPKKQQYAREMLLLLSPTEKLVKNRLKTCQNLFANRLEFDSARFMVSESGAQISRVAIDPIAAASGVNARGFGDDDFYPLMAAYCSDNIVADYERFDVMMKDMSGDPADVAFYGELYGRTQMLMRNELYGLSNSSNRNNAMNDSTNIIKGVNNQLLVSIVTVALMFISALVISRRFFKRDVQENLEQAAVPETEVHNPLHDNIMDDDDRGCSGYEGDERQESKGPDNIEEIFSIAGAQQDGTNSPDFTSPPGANAALSSMSSDVAEEALRIFVRNEAARDGYVSVDPRVRGGSFIDDLSTEPSSNNSPAELSSPDESVTRMIGGGSSMQH